MNHQTMNAIYAVCELDNPSIRPFSVRVSPPLLIAVSLKGKLEAADWTRGLSAKMDDE